LLGIRVIDGIVDGGGGQEATSLRFDGLISQEKDAFVRVPILIEVSIFFVLEEEQFDFFLHSFDYFKHQIRFDSF